MNIKSILKPTIEKFFIAALIFVIFVPFIHYNTGVRCFRAPCPSGTNISLAMWLYLSQNFLIYPISGTNLIIGALLSYLISCLVVFAVDKEK